MPFIDFDLATGMPFYQVFLAFARFLGSLPGFCQVFVFARIFARFFINSQDLARFLYFT